MRVYVWSRRVRYARGISKTTTWRTILYTSAYINFGLVSLNARAPHDFASARQFRFEIWDKRGMKISERRTIGWKRTGKYAHAESNLGTVVSGRCSANSCSQLIDGCLIQIRIWFLQVIQCLLCTGSLVKCAQYSAWQSIQVRSDKSTQNNPRIFYNESLSTASILHLEKHTSVWIRIDFRANK